MLKISSVCFDFSTLVPYVNLDFSTRLVLDRDILFSLRAAVGEKYKEELKELMVEEYRRALEEKFGEILTLLE